MGGRGVARGFGVGHVLSAWVLREGGWRGGGIIDALWPVERRGQVIQYFERALFELAHRGNNYLNIENECFSDNFD